MRGYNDIISDIRNLDKATNKSYDIIAVGGSGLVLHNIKTTTDDVDFIVERGDTMQFEIDYKRHCDNMIDVSAPGECFGTRLPSDYIHRSKYIDSFNKITLRALSVIDIIITKATRSEPRDITDIGECRKRVSVEDVLKRVQEYSLSSDKLVKETILNALS